MKLPKCDTKVAQGLTNLTTFSEVERDALWKKNVTDVQGIIGKAKGLFFYVDAKLAAFSAIRQYKHSEKAYVKALAVAPVEGQTPSAEGAKLAKAARQAENAFFRAFVQRSNMVNPVDTKANIEAAKLGLRVVSRSTKDCNHISVMLKNTPNFLNGKVTKYLTDAYVAQAPASINPTNFAEKAKEIQSYSSMSLAEVEADLRKALNAKHPEKFEELRKNLSDNFDKEVEAYKADVRAKLQPKKDREEALRGPSHFNGEVNAAYEAQVTAQREYTEAVAKLQGEGTLFAGADIETEISKAVLAKATDAKTGASVSEAFSAAVEKAKTLRTATTKFEALKKELQGIQVELAVLGDANLQKVASDDVNARLALLAAIAVAN